MENTNTPIENEQQVAEESKTVIDQVTEDVSKEIEETNSEVQENNDEVVPTTTTTITSTDEQENVTEITSNIPASVSPGRANVPFKEVNETEEGEETTPLVNGTENINSKKRELDQDDEQIQEKILDNDQIKKIKTSESTDIPMIEKPESENNIITNGNTAVEV